MATSVDRARGILELIDLIQHHLDGVDQETFTRDVHMRDATGLRLIAIGETTRAIDPSIKDRYPAIEWSKITAMRNFIAHNYDGISGATLWETVRHHLPALAITCRTIIGEAEER